MNRILTLFVCAVSFNAFGQYQVGDIGPGGGWIFYVDTLDLFEFDFMEVASTTEDRTPNWGGHALVGQNTAASQNLGRGGYYSSLYLGQASPWQIATLSTGGPAALIHANGCTQGGYGDWFLPTIEDCEVMRVAFGDSLVEMISFDPDDPYNYNVWTASCFLDEGNYTRARTYNLSNGNISSQLSTGNQWGNSSGRQVLPIRTFSLQNEQICGVGTVWDEDSQTCIIDETYCSWQPDSDGDQLIGVSDLLMFLSVFGDTDLDQDGIFDSNDDCVGEYDECGVCNGSGPSIPIVESIEILYDSVYAEQIDEWLVYEYADTTFSFTCYEWSCGDPIEYQGYDYETVQIGEQCWFAENLRADTYLNGDSILFVSDAEEWGVQSGAMTRQPDNLSADLGALYNWLAVDDSRGLCPSGWHVSTDSDWQLLNLQAGLPMDELETTGWLGEAQEIGNKLKDPDYWNGGQGYDLFGFGARAGGYMNSGGTGAVGANGDWWTRDVPPPNLHPIRRGLHANEEGNLRCRCSGWNDGFSIRCVRD